MFCLEHSERCTKTPASDFISLPNNAFSSFSSSYELGMRKF
jgi:hypothetical protein